MDYTVILNLILVLTIIIITRISLKINNTNNNLLQQINLLEKKLFDEFSRNRNDNLVNQRELREEVNRNINIFNESIINRVNENTTGMQQLQALKNGVMWFSTKKAAEEYIFLNKPCLFINDVRNCINQTEIDIDNEHELNYQLLQLVKEKLYENK